MVESKTSLPDAFISAVVSYVPFGVVGASCAAAGNRYGWLQHFFRSIIIFNNDTCENIVKFL
jgi:hypothetical protein